MPLLVIYPIIIAFKNAMSTRNQNKKNLFQVKGNNTGAVHTLVKRKYRQYMNRKGGFNRPLDYVH